MENNQATPSRPILLVVDDQPLNAQLLSFIFSNDYEVLTAHSGAEALAICAQRPPDVVLLDIAMPDMDGYEVCRRLKAGEHTRDTHVIFVTAEVDPEEEAAGLTLGAVDFIHKPVNAAVVRARVQTHIQLRQALRQVKELAFHDTLTGLPNRRLLHDRLAQAMVVSQRTLLYGALMLLDLDNFKPLNDTHGHEAGDLLLVEVSKRLLGCVREVDTVARFGGDEFIIVLSALADNEIAATHRASLVAEKIRAAVCEPYPLKVTSEVDDSVEDVLHRCSVSIGITMFLGHESTIARAMKRADVAMYASKEAGRNAVRFFTT